MTALRQSWVTTHGSFHIGMDVDTGSRSYPERGGFTLDAAIGTEPWEAIMLPTRFLNMERVHPQRPASPPLFVFESYQAREQLGWISHWAYLSDTGYP